MAASDQFQGMYDVALKPRLLRSLLKEYVPDEKHPFRNPSDLSHVVSAVKTHQLLSELAPLSTEPKLIDSWKSAVDAWVNRVISLASTTMPDKSWAGICLLGLTCQVCSSERFLASYSVWFNSIISHIQPPSDSHFVRVASCASMSDLFTRLGGFPNVKKDGTSLATKLIQPVLKLLDEDGSDIVWEEVVHLLCVIINVFPSSVGRHYDGVEAAIVSKIISDNYNASILKKLGYGLSLLPKSRGDEESWLSMMQKILIFLNNQLNDAFQGLEEENRRDEVIKLLLPPGKDPPAPLGGSTISGRITDLAMKRPEQFVVSRISTLLLCCCTMLTNSYPIQVLVPVRSLVALARRVLMVDGSLSQAYPFMTAMRQEFICSELPVLHRHCLELLAAIVKGLRSHLLPHVADITRLLTEYFRKCSLPELRIKVYSIMKVLLMSMGVGMAIYLIKEIIDNAFIDLDSRGHERGTESTAVSKASEKVPEQPLQRKRKHSTTTGSLGDQSDRGALDAERSQNLTTIAVRIAALEALEALLTVGGALRSDSWRSGVDHLLITVAKNACKGGWAKEKSSSVYGEATPIWADFQLAALRALLASLLSPGRVRPPYLAQGLDLFRRGSQETGTKIAEYCLHALLTLEVLIHPRALPVVDFELAVDHYDGVAVKLPENIYSSGRRQHTTIHDGTMGKGPCEPESDDDNLYESWLRNGDEMEVPMTDHAKNTKNTEEAPGTSRQPSFEEVTCDVSSGRDEYEEDKLKASVVDAAVATSECKDEMMVEFPSQGSKPTAVNDRVISGSSPLNHMDLGAASAKDVADKDDAITTIVDTCASPTLGKDAPRTQDDGYNMIMKNISAPISSLERNKGIVHEMDDESSIDSIPDIVDADPDTD